MQAQQSEAQPPAPPFPSVEPGGPMREDAASRCNGPRRWSGASKWTPHSGGGGSLPDGGFWSPGCPLAGPLPQQGHITTFCLRVPTLSPPCGERIMSPPPPTCPECVYCVFIPSHGMGAVRLVGGGHHRWGRTGACEMFLALAGSPIQLACRRSTRCPKMVGPNKPWGILNHSLPAAMLLNLALGGGGGGAQAKA